MSLDISLYATRTLEVEVFDGNITHNLGGMADNAGIYKVLWHPEEIGVTKAGQLIPLLREGLAKLKADPEHYRHFDSPNGWGRYENLVRFTEEYLEACEAHPDARIVAHR